MSSARPPLQQVSRKVHSAICGLVSEGADRRDISLTLLAYALSLEFEACGARHVVNHLRRIARKFELADGRTFTEIAYSEPLQDQKTRSSA